MGKTFDSPHIAIPGISYSCLYTAGVIARIIGSVGPQYSQGGFYAVERLETVEEKIFCHFVASRGLKIFQSLFDYHKKIIKFCRFSMCTQKSHEMVYKLLLLKYIQTELYGVSVHVFIYLLSLQFMISLSTCSERDY